MSIFLLIQFVFRTTFGVALAMGVTPSRFITSGFYRVHLWVLMGLNTLAALTIYTQRESLMWKSDQVLLVLGLAIGLVVASYLGAVLWLYEKSGPGKIALWGVTIGGLLAAALATSFHESITGMNVLGVTLNLLSVATSGLVLGVTLCAMFLGHWYLNTPTMELKPLKRLVLLMATVIVLRASVCGMGLLLHSQAESALDTAFWIFVALRWLAGLIGTFGLAVMTWLTLKIPNTQSATGILYAGVILSFIGELTSQFLSFDARYPL